jgi:hypothetical protein
MRVDLRFYQVSDMLNLAHIIIQENKGKII